MVDEPLEFLSQGPLPDAGEANHRCPPNMAVSAVLGSNNSSLEVNERVLD